MRRRLLASFVAVLATTGCDDKPKETEPPTINPPGPEPLAEGAAAPDVKLPLHDGSSVQLSALKGNLVLLYFYPQDDTPG